MISIPFFVKIKTGKQVLSIYINENHATLKFTLPCIVYTVDKLIDFDLYIFHRRICYLVRDYDVGVKVSSY